MLALQPAHNSSLGAWIFATHLTDILVAHPADLLDISSGLGDTLEGVAGEDELILLGLGDLDIDTGLHNDAADDLLANEVAAHTPLVSIFGPPRCIRRLVFQILLERDSFPNVPDLDLEVASLGVLLNVDVDGEMGIDVAHLVLEALGDTDDQVVDDGADGTESGNVLAVAMVNLETDDALLDDGEVDGDVAEVLNELATGALDGNDPGLDRDLDCKPKVALVIRILYATSPNTVVSISKLGRPAKKKRPSPVWQLSSPDSLSQSTHSHANSSPPGGCRRSVGRFRLAKPAPRPSSLARAVDIAE